MNNINSFTNMVNRFLTEMLKLNDVVDIRHHLVRKFDNKHTISIDLEGFQFDSEKYSSYSEYFNLLDNKLYSLLFKNGDMIQISYTYKNSILMKHRLSWYPSPIILQNYYPELSISETVLEYISNCDFDNIFLRTPVRFDYDVESAKEKHPASHLHLNSANSRMAVEYPLCLYKFLRFVSMYMYPQKKSLISFIDSFDWGILKEKKDKYMPVIKWSK